MIGIDLIKLLPLWVLILLGLAWYSRRKIRSGKTKITQKQPHLATKPKEAEYSEEAYHHIEPLTNFNLQNTEPIKIRLFKPKYHLTMAIENTAMADLIAMDNTYASRCSLRKQLIQQRESDVLAVNPVIQPAIYEFYSWLMETYLPRRLPSLFTLVPSEGLKNEVTGEILPLKLESAREALRILGQNIDTDFLLLLPIPAGEKDEGKYRLEGFVTCFPSGFNTPQKLGLKLADIHGPVPSYAERLEKSMDRFFSSLPAGRIVKRHNWSITTNRELFCLAGNHLTEEEARDSAAEREAEEGFDIDECVLRCERQTLHRLPRSEALVFGFKTYQYPLRGVRDEDGGEMGRRLADAIEGLGTGNAPGMRVYKREVVWGEKVKRFLRGQLDS